MIVVSVGDDASVENRLYWVLVRFRFHLLDTVDWAQLIAAGIFRLLRGGENWGRRGGASWVTITIRVCWTRSAHPVAYFVVQLFTEFCGRKNFYYTNEPFKLFSHQNFFYLPKFSATNCVLLSSNARALSSRPFIRLFACSSCASSCKYSWISCCLLKPSNLSHLTFS